MVRFFCLVLMFLPSIVSVNYFGYKLFRFTPSNGLMDFLESDEQIQNGRIDKNGDRMPLIDVFAEPNHRRESADILVAPDFVEDFIVLCESRGVEDLQIVEENIQRELTAEKNTAIRQRRRRRRNVFASSGPAAIRSFDVFAYHRYGEIVAHLRALAAFKPKMVTFLNISKTFEGRDLVGVKISATAGNSAKPSVFIDAGIHAREWIAPAVSLYMIDRLINEYETNSKVKWLVDEFDWYIVPVANPDGYEYSMSKDRLWRKTRSRNTSVNKWCVGADANRNWGYRWGEAGANRSPCSNIYAGSEPFSETEALGMKEFIKGIPNLKIYASLHAYGQLFLSPWGYTNERPKNYLDQQLAAKYAVDAIRNATGAQYQYGSIAEVMYPASGTSIDYMQSIGVPYIYGIELRPEDLDTTFGFSMPANQIEPTGRDMMVAFTKITEYIHTKGRSSRRVFVRRRQQ